MSDILIHGMEMPKEGDLIVIRPDWKAYYVSANPQNAYEGEAVPVPPHGRLIDADDLANSITGAIYHSDLREAPTIIPAEEGE